MSMVVRTNTMAINANSALNKNNSTVAGNLQKLSTGFRINRAADDASGLAVSEKMKAQIKALDQAGKNAQDGASLIKTAEGYMGEIHDMLNRIVELAEKSANGTYETKTDENYTNAATDRQAIQDEVDQLTTEIDRIANTANFNQLKLLDGSLDSTIPVTKQPDTVDTSEWFTDANGTTPATSYTEGTTYYKVTKAAVNPTYSDTGITGNENEPSDWGTAVYATKDGDVYTPATGAYDGTKTYYKQTNAGSAAEYGEVTAADIASKTTPGQEVEGTATGKALKLQIGETSDAADKLEVSIMNFQTSSLFADAAKEVGTDSQGNAINILVDNESDAAKTAGITGKTFNVSNQDAASVVAEKVRDVINKVSSQRATLGAMENRLDYTMNNLDTASQNITDANSRIRDTDMAKTMMEYTQGNTLTQAAQAMLAQANQAPSQVLQLLQ